jgi:hypothetical protein
MLSRSESRQWAGLCVSIADNRIGSSHSAGQEPPIMFATERSRQNLRLAGALLLAIGARVYLSRGGAEAMVFTTPRLSSRYEAQTLLVYAALAIAVSASVAAAGKRWVGRLASVGLGGVAGLLAISQYNAILGAVIGLVIGVMVACDIFLPVLIAFARVAAAIAFGVACGAAALATQRDLSGGPNAIVLVLMTAAAVIAAFFKFWPRPNSTRTEWTRRRLKSFSRTRLFLFVIFGLWLSLSVDTVRRASRLGSHSNANAFSPEVSWLWRGCVTVTHVWGREGLADGDLSDLRGFADLFALDLRNTLATDAGLAQLRGLPRLRRLVLNGREITGDGFADLATLPTLTELYLDDTQVGDRKLAALARLAALRQLLLANTNVTDEGLVQIGKLTALGYLDLSGTQVSNEGLKRLQNLRSLSYLHLSHTQITGDGLQHLAPLAWLQVLDLSQTQVSDADLEKLPVLPRLERLWLDGTEITDAGLAHLSKQPMLKVVDAYETAITAEGAEQFRKAMLQRTTKPECIVNR